MSAEYDSNYFATRRELTSYSANAILAQLAGELKEATVLDLGCGVGTWAAVAKSFGASKVHGIDGPWVPKHTLDIAQAEFSAHDLRSGSPPTDERFDLIIWLENAEHLPSKVGGKLVEWVANHTDMVLFSAAIPGQGGRGHYNERWQSYWANLFAYHGFVSFDIIRPQIWLDTNIPYWYRQNIVVYLSSVRREDISLSKYTQAPSSMLDIVHPERWERQLGSQIGIKNALRLLSETIKSKVTKQR